MDIGYNIGIDVGKSSDFPSFPDMFAVLAGQTIKLQMEDDEPEQEEEGEGGGGLHRHADLYQKSLGCFFDDGILHQVFMDRWMKMSEEVSLPLSPPLCSLYPLLSASREYPQESVCFEPPRRVVWR